MLFSILINKKDNIIKIIGIILFILELLFICNTSNIIITNKNKITIAPTYIIINKNEINSKLKFIKIIKEKKNINTNQKTEWIGFNEFMHIKHPKIIKIEKIKKNSFMIKL